MLDAVERSGRDGDARRHDRVVGARAGDRVAVVARRPEHGLTAEQLGVLPSLLFEALALGAPAFACLHPARAMMRLEPAEGAHERHRERTEQDRQEDEQRRHQTAKRRPPEVRAIHDLHLTCGATGAHAE